MTRKEKLELLNRLLEIEEKNDIGNLTRTERGEFQQWFKVLEQEPCEDAVSRSSLLGKLDDCYKEKVKIAPDNMAEGFAQVEKLIKQEPSVTPTRKVGKWIDTERHHYYGDGEIETTDLRCSCCKEEVEWDIGLPHKPHYCENCGKEMEGAE